MNGYVAAQFRAIGCHPDWNSSGSDYVLELSPKTIRDLRLSLTHSELWRLLAMQDIRRRYRRSIIGPFWLTIATSVMIGFMGLLYAPIMGVSMQTYVPHFAIGLIFWQFIATTLNESTTCFIESAPLSRQLPLPWTSLLMRIIARNCIVFAHNFVIIPVVLFFFSVPVNWATLLVIPGMVLVLALVTILSLGLAIAGVRFRDIEPTVASLLQISFFVTPILWLPQNLPANPVVGLFPQVNIFYHLLNVVRDPLMGKVPPASSYIFILLAISLCGILALFAFNRVRTRIVFWC